MNVVKPIDITEAVFTASSIAEPDASVGEVEWEDDIFSGYFFNNNETEKKAFDAIEMDGSIFVIEGNYSLSGSRPWLHKYELDGTHTSSFELSSVNPAPFISRSHIANCVAIISNLPEVKIYNIITNSLVSFHQVSSEITNPSGMCFDGNSYFISDFETGKAKRFNTSFSHDNFEVDLGVGIGNGASLKINNGALSVFDRQSNEIKKINLDGSEFSKVDVSNNINSPGDCYGHFYIESSVYAISNIDSKAYKYTGGIYDGYYQPQERVIKTSTHTQYQCTIATADDPEVGVDKIPQTWVEVGPTNKWAVFDDKKTTKSKSSAPYTIQLVPGVTIDSLAGFAISGATDVTIIATSASAGEVFNETIDLINIDSAYDFYTWYTYELDYIDEFVVTNIPPYPDLTIDITFTGSVIEVGNIVTGRKRTLGILQTGVISDRIDYSRTTIDDFGEETTVIRPITKYSTYPLVIEKIQAPSVLRFLDGLRGLKCVWIGDIGDNQNLTTFGAIERSPLVYDNLSISEYQIKVRGSI